VLDSQIAARFARGLFASLGIMSKETEASGMVAHRDLEFVRAAGDREPVRVSIFVPVPGELEGQWWCECVIEGKSFRKPFRIAGGDSIHALTLTLTTIPEELEQLSQRHNGVFHFLGEAGHEFHRLANG
jgi:hypothetical protein